MTITELLADPVALERGRKAVEDTLIDFRDSRLSIIGPGNGLVIHEADGQESHIIRLSVLDAFVIALRAASPPPGEVKP